MKRLLALTLIFTLLAAAPAAAVTYHDYVQETVIGDGITLTHIKRFESSGWQNINIVKADLTVDHIKAELLTDQRGTGYLSNVLNMAKADDSIAAVNSDFFGWKGAAGSANGYPVGLEIQDGKLISSANQASGYASLAVDETGWIFLDYLTTDITITAPDGESRKVKNINKYDPLDKINLYTAAFGPVSDGSYDNVLEVVVENGIVTDMRRELDGIPYPENGYIIRHLPEFDSFLLDHFSVGDPVQLDVSTNFDVEKMKLVAGGGTLLVKDGQKAPITHNVAGANPRTIGGTDQSGRYLYLITVDGRTNDAAGMTMSQMQDFLLEQNIYHAINFDGGGSTTMVTRDPQTGEHKVTNDSGTSYLRPVAVGVQLKSTAPQGELGSYLLYCDDTKVFAGTSRTFYVSGGLDQYKNPYHGELPPAAWEIDSEYGYFEGNVLHATKPGYGITVTARNGEVTGTMQIDILEPPVSLTPSPSHFYSFDAQDPVYTLWGTDARGMTALIEKRDITLSGELTGELGYKEVSAAGAHSFLTFCGPDSDTFEGGNGKASAYPSNTAKANYAISSEHAKSGSNAGKLYYDFTNQDAQTKAAYVVFNQPKPVIAGTKQIGVWVYSQYPLHQWLRAEFTDNKGELQRVTLSESIDFTGWKFLTAPIDASYQTLNKLYLVQNDHMVANAGYVLFDNLTFIQQAEPVNYPAELISVNPQAPSYTQGEYTFAVMGGLPSSQTLLANLFQTKAAFALNNAGASNAWFLTSMPSKLYNNLQLPYKGLNGYESYVDGRNQFITIHNSNDGISKTNKAQWDWLTTDLGKDYDNLFVFLPRNMDTITDAREAAVFRDILIEKAKEKNITVFYPDKADQVRWADGVQYISLAGVDAPDAALAAKFVSSYCYAKVTIVDGVPSVYFERIY